MARARASRQVEITTIQQLRIDAAEIAVQLSDAADEDADAEKHAAAWSEVAGHLDVLGAGGAVAGPGMMEIVLGSVASVRGALNKDDYRKVIGLSGCALKAVSTELLAANGRSVSFDLPGEITIGES